MALHVREQIMVSALAALTGLATTAANVWRDRDTAERPLQSSELPGLVLEDNGDPSETITLGNAGILERTMRLRVSAHVKKTAGYSADINQILKEVEIALSTSPTGSKFAHLVNVAGREISEAADQPTVRQAFDFECLYYTTRIAPDVAL